MISIHVKLFAVAKDLAGTDETTFASGQCVGFERPRPPLESRSKVLSLEDHLRIAVNSEYVDLNHPLRDGDEVAIIPPVSGG